MMKIKKISLCILLCFSFVFINFGYAKLTQNYNISGSIDEITFKKPLFYISNVEVVSQSNVTSLSNVIGLPTILNNTFDVSSNNGSITLKISVTNESNYTYWFDSIKYLEDYENNNLIGQSNGVSILLKDKQTDTTSTFDSGDWVPPNSIRDFYVTYSFGSNVNDLDKVLLSINYSFLIKIDSFEDEFLQILNNKDTYSYLSTSFDNAGGTVINNIDNQNIFDTLFGPNMQIEVDGELKDVTIYIRRDNIDGQNGNGDQNGREYTLYITVDDVTTGSPTVYAISYTKKNNEWHQIGQLYEGTVKVADGELDVYDWIATYKNYKVADGIEYLVGSTTVGDQFDKLNTMEQLITTNDSDFFNAIDNSQILRKVDNILKANSNSNSAEIVALRNAFKAAKPYYYEHLQIKRNCTRAEIIGYLVEIQEALDYYYQINGKS